ncbi:RHS repeat protein [Pseudomonas sp. RA_105y_Pfl2_P56]|uniref:RHS repeat protein n=1 Tax=Pseudomonas sp. RA_105y_Pfl2_P56 TaxID=3088701 RepID=UPI0030DA268C
MNSVFQQSSQIKKYLYEDDHDSRLLTGIIDERGIRYATWTYDSIGRAISSEHSQGAERVDIQYHSDESVTVSNALGKGTTYNFGYFQGIKHITSIIGEPTTDCPKSNSTFSYDERGLLTSQTDSKGVTTLYTHNDRGLETSRTEASNTPESRTTTEWHDTQPLPLKIKQPTRSIQYTYDAEGRRLSQTIKIH